MRSRLCFLYPGILGACECTWKYRWPIDRFHSARNQGHVKWMSLIACGSIHEGLEWFSDDSRGRQENFICLAAVLCEQFCRFANEGAKISIKSFRLHEIILFCLMYSAAVKCKPKLLPFGKKCWLMLAGLGKKKRGNCEANLLYVESDFATTDTTDKSFTVSASWVR